MKATRTTPVVPPPPDIVLLELSVEEAEQLRRIAGYNLTIAEAIEIRDSSKQKTTAAFLHRIFGVLGSVTP